MPSLKPATSLCQCAVVLYQETSFTDKWQAQLPSLQPLELARSLPPHFPYYLQLQPTFLCCPHDMQGLLYQELQSVRVRASLLDLKTSGPALLTDSGG